MSERETASWWVRFRLTGRRRVGLLGGTFDPIHIGHLIIGEEARARLELDTVLFIPSRHPWRKEGREIAPEADRLAMVQAAVAGNACFAVSAVDLNRAGPTYSVDTVRDVRLQQPDADLFLILGYDALLDLPNWRNPRLLVESAHIVAMLRPLYWVDWAAVEQVAPEARQHITVLEMSGVGISSSEVRRRVASGRSVRYWVPDAVIAYIAERGLYRLTEP